VPKSSKHSLGLSPAHLKVALWRLRQAWDCAEEYGRPIWEFGIETEDLWDCGLTHRDLLRLLRDQYLEDAFKISPSGTERRRFKKSSSLAVSRKNCFVLTKKGAALAHKFGAPRIRTPSQARKIATTKPEWDHELGELYFAGLLVKRLDVRARNQRALLDSFQELRWFWRTDDPMTGGHDINRKRRLHDAIKDLNHNQVHPLLRFHGDGTGQCCKWQPKFQD
jgi:hypothetical protein